MNLREELDGESDDDSLTIEKQVDNLKSAILYVKYPVLIIHGNNDEEENLLWERSKAGIDLLSTYSKLMLIDGADHSFLDHIDKLISRFNKNSRHI